MGFHQSRPLITHIHVPILILAHTQIIPNLYSRKYCSDLRRSATLILIFLYLSATTSLGELFRLPVLISHFVEHKADNNSITFYKFLYQHYHADDGNDQDNDRDSQLPFKSQDMGSSPSSYSFGIHHPISGIFFSPLLVSSSLNTANYKEPYIPSACLNRIWQPPKFS